MRRGKSTELFLSVGVEEDGIFWSGGSSLFEVTLSVVNRQAFFHELSDLEKYLKLL